MRPFFSALANLFSSRKFIVLLVSQAAIAYPAIFGRMDPQFAAELGTALAAAWMASHAVEQRGKAGAPAPEAPAPVAGA